MTSGKPLTAHERALVLADAFQGLDFKTRIDPFLASTPHPKSYALTITSPRGLSAVLRVDPDGRIIVWSKHNGVDTHGLLRKLGLGDFVKPGIEHRPKMYSVRYVHKISPSPNDVAPHDITLTYEDTHRGDRRRLAKALREQDILSKGETVRDFRVEDNGRIVVFPPRASIWHAIVLEPRT
jgi:hypothetical protein